MSIYDKFMLAASSGKVTALMGRNEFPVAFVDGNKKPKPNTAFKRYEYSVVEVQNKFVKLELLSLGSEAVGWKATDVNNVEALVVLPHGESHRLLKSPQTTGGVFQAEFWLQWVNSAFTVVKDEDTLGRCKAWTALKKGNHLPSVGSVVRLITGARLVYLGDMCKAPGEKPDLVLKVLKEADSLDVYSQGNFTKWEAICQWVSEMESEFCAETTEYQAHYKATYAYLNKDFKIYSLSKDEYTLRSSRCHLTSHAKAAVISFNAHDTQNEVKITCIPEVIRSFNSDEETISTLQVSTRVDDQGNLLWDQPSFVETATSYQESLGTALSEVLMPFKDQFQLLEKLNQIRNPQYDYTIEVHPKHGEVRVVEFGSISGEGHIRCLILRDNSIEVHTEHSKNVESLSWLRNCLYKEVLMALRDRDLIKVWSANHPDFREIIAIDHPSAVALIKYSL